MSNQTDWPGWITALGTGATAAGGLIVVTLKSFFVTHGQMRQYFEDRDQERLRMHEENKADTCALRDDIGEVKGALQRLEGQLSGRYPSIKR